MATQLTLDQLRNNLCLPANSTSIQRHEADNNYVGALVEMKNLLIQDINFDEIHLSSSAASGRIIVRFEKHDLAEKNLTLFSQLERVNIIAQLVHVSYSGSYVTDFVEPYEYLLELISIEKEKAIVVHDSSKNDPSCFVATACYGDCNREEVLILRQFRDEKLLKSFSGKLFVKFYYSVSPLFAILISKSDILKRTVIQYFLNPIVKGLQQQK